MNIRTLVLGTLLSFTGILPAQAIEEGEQAPLFTLPDIQEGKPDISLESLRGKTVYVDFWASWCAPCLRSMPLINELYAKYKDRGFEVVAINVDDPIEDGQEFLLDTPLDYLIAADTDNDVLEAFGVTGMPTSFLVDRDGVVRMVHMGFRDGDIAGIEAAISALLD
ncbi:MAG: TlpA family protein disulfide reductase [Pseudomonadales bacterium]|nr:TlpA family protein disulfide reductase [Pseudomonadales bacterium]MCP5358664.1 TlpA family protein disulfide reductase [Pseudomonadales bacterium]